MKKNTILLLFVFLATGLNAQMLFEKSGSFSRADSLRGSLSPLRTCYDVVYYDLYVDVNPADKSIKGSNTIRFKVVDDFDRMQIDLSDKLTIDSIIYNKGALTFKREFNAVFVQFPAKLQKGGVDAIKVYYHGLPIVAKMPPWDGGLVFSKDANNKHWMGVACEGIGASTWWPCKDHLSDEADSMDISGPAPKGLQFISNGILKSTTSLPDGREVNRWHVSYPMNNYNATYYIGDFEHFSETYQSPTGKKLDLNYYVLPYNMEKAQRHFAEVKPMMECYEKFFGPYPFWNDGFKLVESPYLGMEHQSAIAYGNGYKYGYAGMDFSGFGLKSDFIIVHESGHEWWGNHVTMADMADMWISEGFCTYAEVVYVECRWGPEKALKYANNKKASVENDKPIIGAYGVNNEGSGDMYNKASLMIHTLRSVINNDKLFFDILLGLQTEFGMKQIATADVVNYYNTKTGMDLTPIFNQYLRFVNIPVFEYRLDTRGPKTVLAYRWKVDVPEFAMPLDVFIVSNGKEVKQHLTPTSNWQRLPLSGLEGTISLKADTEHFYIKATQVEKVN